MARTGQLDTLVPSLSMDAMLMLMRLRSRLVISASTITLCITLLFTLVAEWLLLTVWILLDITNIPMLPWTTAAVTFRRNKGERFFMLISLHYYYYCLLLLSSLLFPVLFSFFLLILYIPKIPQSFVCFFKIRSGERKNKKSSST